MIFVPAGRLTVHVYVPVRWQTPEWKVEKYVRIVLHAGKVVTDVY